MKCHFCKTDAIAKWAKKVPLCKTHHNALFIEQLDWYGKRISSGERVLWNQIATMLRPKGRQRGIRGRAV